MLLIVAAGELARQVVECGRRALFIVHVARSPAGRRIYAKAPVAVTLAMIRYSFTGSCLPPIDPARLAARLLRIATSWPVRHAMVLAFIAIMVRLL